jgi:hypothetical protein
VHRQLGDVEVKAGQVAQVNFGANGRTVTGRVNLTGTNAIADLAHTQVAIHSGSALRSGSLKFLERLEKFGTAEARKAFFESEEFKNAMKDLHYFPATILPDGSFRVEDVPPGKYELSISLNPVSQKQVLTQVIFSSLQEFDVPEPKNPGDATPVQLGAIDLKRFAITVDLPDTAAK